MADEQRKADATYSGYRQVAPAGVAPEVTAGAAISPEASIAFGRWLAERLRADSSDMERAHRQRLASLSGFDSTDLSRLLAGQAGVPLDPDGLQRLAVALVEMQLVQHSGEVWEAAGIPSQSDYIIPPGQVVRAVSGND